MPEVSAVRSGDAVVALLTSGGYRDLYYDWEKNQWEAAGLDLSSDVAGWDGLEPLLARRLSDSVTWRAVRARSAITALVPFVDAAPTEEQQVTLTTQLVDEARHLVFFERYLEEVMGRVSSDDEWRRLDVPGLDRLFEPILSEAAGRIGAGADDALVSGVTMYHLGILALLALPDAEDLRGLLAEAGALPGLERGLQLETAALSRHVAFGLRFIGDAIANDPGLTGTARKAFDQVRPLALAALDALRKPVGTEQSRIPDGGTPEKAPAAWFQAAGVGFLLSD